MALNIDFSTALKSVKADNQSKTSGFPDRPKDMTHSFKERLTEATAGRSEQMRKPDERYALRKEMLGRSESKLTGMKKPDTDRKTDSPSEDEVNNKKEKAVIKMEEILSKLEEMMKLHQAGDIPVDKLSALQENIKEAVKELAEAQGSSIGTQAEGIETKASELTIMLKGILGELEADGKLANNKPAEEFTEALKEMLEQLKVANDLKQDAKAGDRTAENSIKQNTGINVMTKKEDAELQNEALTVNSAPKSEENGHKTESSQANDTVEKEVKIIKAEAHIDISNSLNKEPKAEADDSLEAVKTALDGKVDKIAVENKESSRQEGEAGTNKEASEELPKAAASAPKEMEITAAVPVKEQIEIADNKLQELQKQAAEIKPVVIDKTEVINQIVKKAELITIDSQPELRMQLEPENLGKLTLKLAVEKGLVTAKFVAESYEVKQIIESSFNELKDMLQEKGMSIQSLSVSVGQQNKEFNDSSTFNQWKETVKLNGTRNSRNGYQGYGENVSETSRVINPYSVHNGKFDYRA